MGADFRAHELAHRWDQSATHPIAPPWRALAALRLLAGISLPRRHALPAHSMTAHSMTAHPMTAHSGASNGGF
ncbi:MAG: hypothetical protein Q7T46_07570 [Polaromonas sp.]|nr:hypothetical protein [Polaromonas sp.]